MLELITRRSQVRILPPLVVVSKGLALIVSPFLYGKFWASVS